MGLLLLLIGASSQLSASSGSITWIEVSERFHDSDGAPKFDEILKVSDWELVKNSGLLEDNHPFLIRISMDSIMRGEPERILSIASVATLFVYQLDGSTIVVRDLATTSEKVNDKLSLKINPTQSKAAYLYAWVVPRNTWLPSEQPKTTYGLWLVTTSIDEYDIIDTHFNKEGIESIEKGMLILLGGIFLMGCYFGLLYFSNTKEYIFGIYSAYLFFHAIYWVERILPLSLPFFDRAIDQLVVNTVSQICFHVAFTFLAHELLNFRKYYPLWGKIWRAFAAAQLGFAVLFTILVYSGVDSVLLLDIFSIERGFTGVVAIFTTLYFVIKPHSIYCYYLGFASFSFVGSALTAMFTGNLIYFAFGLAIEILTFAFAIGQKIRKADEARIESEKSAFMLEREVIRTKDAALRAQMNPHFVSNVINALRALILDGENEQAYSYLSRFAHVVRTMLGSADKHLIPLNEELRLLKDYVSLEELRFGRTVNFNFLIDERIDQEGALIPPMLLQPLVENAMHHGLFPLTERTPTINVQINTIQNSELLEIIVSDNGIGRTKAALNQKKRLRQRPSMAMNIIKERIKLLQESSNIVSNEILKIEDLTDHNEIGIGTKVTINIPRTILKTQLGAVLEPTSRSSKFKSMLRGEKQQSF